METAIILLAEGFEEAEAVITADMLKRAGIETKTAAVSEESSNIVKSSGALEIKCDINISDIKDIPDAVILPGGMAGTENLFKSQQSKELILKMFDLKKIIAAICAAPSIVLSPLGILDNKKATCYPGLNQNFNSTTEYVKEKVVKDQNIITSMGPGTAFIFALEIIRHFKGKETANLVKKQALIDI